MGTVDLDYLKQGFASLVQQAEHTTLPTFILWLDLKVAEFKVNGFMMLDDSRISGEGWLEFIQRWRNHSLGAYTGYQYIHPSFAANQGGHHNPSPGSHITTAENIPHSSRPRGLEHGDLTDPLRQHRVSEAGSSAGDHGRGQPDNVVQIKPEPGFERLQQELRHERSHPSHIYSEAAQASQHQRRPSFDYPVISDSMPPMDMVRRADRMSLPLEYRAHMERPLLRQNNGSHDTVPPEFLGDTNTRNKDGLPERGTLRLGVDSRDSERDSLQTTVSGFFKTTHSSGVPLVSRQTANRCPVCNRIFHYYSSFNRHMKLHQGVFTHICEVCRRKFTRKEHFVRHKCHRRPNKPSRMADLNEADTSVAGAEDALVQPPPTSNEASPREVSIPPPLIHISEMAETLTSSASRNAFTYDTQQPLYPESSPVTTMMESVPMEVGFRNNVESNEHPPYVVETSTNNKHRRKTTTPMKVEAFMEPPPSVDTLTETPTRCSPVDPPDVFDKHTVDYSREVAMTTYRRASSTDLGKMSTSAGEFNISRPQSRNSEPARGSHYDRGNLDQSLEGTSGSYQEAQDEKRQSLSAESTPTPTPVVLRDDQYPVLKRKVLEAACSLSKLDSSNNNYPEPGDTEDRVRGVASNPSVYPGQEGSEQEQLPGGNAGPTYSKDSSTEVLPTDYSATGTPTSHSSPTSGGGDTALTNPNAAPTTPTSDATPSSATAMSPYGSQSGEGPSGDYEQNISPGGSLKDNLPSLNMSLSALSAYTTSSEPSSPASKQQGDIHCQSCNRRFLHLSSLNRHMKLHKGVFSHACAVCSRKFTRKEHFVNHKCSRRPRNPTRVMDSEPDAQSSGLPQKVEFPPSMTLPRQSSPPEGATWNAGTLSISPMSPVALLPTGLPCPPGTPTASGEASSPPTLSPQSPTGDQRPIFKWKSKWK